MSGDACALLCGVAGGEEEEDEREREREKSSRVEVEVEGEGSVRGACVANLRRVGALALRAWNGITSAGAILYLASDYGTSLVGNIVRTTFSNGDDRKAFVVLTFRLAVKVLLHIASK